MVLKAKMTQTQQGRFFPTGDVACQLFIPGSVLLCLLLCFVPLYSCRPSGFSQLGVLSQFSPITRGSGGSRPELLLLIVIMHLPGIT